MNFIIPMLVLLTDGRSNISIIEGADPMGEIEKLGKLVQEEGIFSIVIDTEVTSKNKFLDFSFEFAKDIAEYLGAKYYRLDQLNAVSLGNLITIEKKQMISRVT
jgi:Mg-chelatase subunit ChlD